MLQVDGVGKVVFAGDQQEVIYLELSRERAAALGVSLNNVFLALSEQNTVVPSGSIQIDDRRIAITPAGEIEAV